MCAEGSFFLGAIATAAVATRIQLPGILGLIVPILAGGVTGALLCLVPALLKAKLNASEMVASLMLNYALYLGLFSLNSFLRDQSFGALATDKLPEVSKLRRGSFVAHLYIAGVLCGFVYCFVLSAGI